MPQNNKRVSHMNNKKLMTYAFLAAVTLSQAAFAENKADTSAQEITKEAVVAAAEDYQIEDFERAQPRRSALFLHILDSVVKGSTLAKADTATDYTMQLSELFGSDGTLL